MTKDLRRRSARRTADATQRDAQALQNESAARPVPTAKPLYAVVPQRDWRPDNNPWCYDWRDLEGSYLDLPTEFEKRSDVHMASFGKDSPGDFSNPTTTHGVMPAPSPFPAEWQSQASPELDALRLEHDRTINARFDLLNIYAQPRRIERDRKLAESRDALAKATGQTAPLTGEAKAADLRLRLRLYFDTIANLEGLRDEVQTVEIARAQATESHLLAVHAYNARAIQSKHPAMIRYLETPGRHASK